MRKDGRMEGGREGVREVECVHVQCKDAVLTSFSPISRFFMYVKRCLNLQCNVGYQREQHALLTTHGILLDLPSPG